MSTMTLVLLKGRCPSCHTEIDVPYSARPVLDEQTAEVHWSFQRPLGEYPTCDEQCKKMFEALRRMKGAA